VNVESEKELLFHAALESEENLYFASMYAWHFEELFGRLLARLLRSLRSQLLEELSPNWTIPEILDPIPLSETHSHLLRVLPSSPQISVHVALLIERSRNSRLPYLVVRANSNEVSKETQSKIREKIDQVHHKGRVAEGYSLWYFYLPEPYRDWAKPETISLIYRQTELLDYLAGHLQGLTQVIGDYSDQRVN
jgi:DNA-directed RNA polymerase subunit F